MNHLDKHNKKLDKVSYHPDHLYALVSTWWVLYLQSFLGETLNKTEWL